MRSSLSRLLGVYDAADEDDESAADPTALVDGRDAVPERDRY